MDHGLADVNADDVGDFAELGQHVETGIAQADNDDGGLGGHGLLAGGCETRW